MAHSKPNLILALVLLTTACPAAGASVMRVHSSGEVEAMQTESVTDLANMFSDDLEAKAMASKLLEGTPPDARGQISQWCEDGKKKTQQSNDDARARLEAAFAEIASCKAAMDTGMGATEGKKNSCIGKSDEHAACRKEESSKFTIKEHWKVETWKKKEVMERARIDFEQVEKEAKTEKEEWSGGDEGAYLKRVLQKFCNPPSGLLPRYRETKERYETAIAEYRRVSEIYETKKTAYIVQKAKCDGIQTEMDVTCCEYSLATKGVCTSYDTCYEDKVEDYEETNAGIQAEVKVMEVEWRVYERILCLVPLLGSDDHAGIMACRAKTHDWSHLKIDKHAIPGKSACHVDEAFPGTDAYYTTHFGNLPENAKGKDVAECAGMTGDESPRPGQEPVKLGCFIDDGSRAFAGGSVRLGKDSNTVSKCADHCSGKAYMAVQDGDECFCGDSYKTEAPYVKVGDSQCSKNSACGVQHGCGNAWKNTIYNLP